MNTKVKRSLSGIYFTEKQEDGTYEPVCFEDLDSETQLEKIKDYDIESIKRLAIMLADTINIIGNKFDLISG